MFYWKLSLNDVYFKYSDSQIILRLYVWLAVNEQTNLVMFLLPFHFGYSEMANQSVWQSFNLKISIKKNKQSNDILATFQIVNLFLHDFILAKGRVETCFWLHKKRTSSYKVVNLAWKTGQFHKLSDSCLDRQIVL